MFNYFDSNHKVYQYESLYFQFFDWKEQNSKILNIIKIKKKGSGLDVSGYNIKCCLPRLIKSLLRRHTPTILQSRTESLVSLDVLQLVHHYKHLLMPCSHYRTIICDKGKNCQSPVILGHRVYASQDVARCRAGNPLQSPTVSCSLRSSWRTSDVGEFFELVQKYRRGWNLLKWSYVVAYSLPDHRLCIGIGR